MDENVKRQQPTTPPEWIDEIRLAIADAKEAEPFGKFTGEPITDANLFHLAPVVCMKFRGFDLRNEKLRNKVTEGALEPDGIDHGSGNPAPAACSPKRLKYRA